MVLYFFPWPLLQFRTIKGKTTNTVDYTYFIEPFGGMSKISQTLAFIDNPRWTNFYFIFETFMIDVFLEVFIIQTVIIPNFIHSLVIKNAYHWHWKVVVLSKKEFKVYNQYLFH